MTLFIVPVLYDLFYRKPPVNIDVGDDGMDDLPGESGGGGRAPPAVPPRMRPKRPPKKSAARI